MQIKDMELEITYTGLKSFRNGLFILLIVLLGYVYISYRQVNGSKYIFLEKLEEMDRYVIELQQKINSYSVRERSFLGIENENERQRDEISDKELLPVIKNENKPPSQTELKNYLPEFPLFEDTKENFQNKLLPCTPLPKKPVREVKPLVVDKSTANLDAKLMDARSYLKQLDRYLSVSTRSENVQSIDVYKKVQDLHSKMNKILISTEPKRLVKLEKKEKERLYLELELLNSTLQNFIIIATKYAPPNFYNEQNNVHNDIVNNPSLADRKLIDNNKYQIEEINPIVKKSAFYSKPTTESKAIFYLSDLSFKDTLGNLFIKNITLTLNGKALDVYNYYECKSGSCISLKIDKDLIKESNEVKVLFSTTRRTYSNITIAADKLLKGDPIDIRLCRN